MNYIFLIIASILAAFGQLSLKKGAISSTTEIQNIITYLFSLVLNPFMWSGFFCYGLSFLVYMIALKQLDLSIARSFSALSYVLVILLSFIFFNDSLNIYKILGISAIFLGIILIALSERQI